MFDIHYKPRCHWFYFALNFKKVLQKLNLVHKSVGLKFFHLYRKLVPLQFEAATFLS